MSPGAEELVEEEAFDRFRRLISVEASVFDSELLWIIFYASCSYERTVTPLATAVWGRLIPAGPAAFSVFFSYLVC